MNQNEILKHIEFSQKKSQEILSKLSNQKLSLEETIDYIRLNNDKFERAYKEGYDQFNDTGYKKDFTKFLNFSEKTKSNFFGQKNNFTARSSPY